MNRTDCLSSSVNLLIYLFFISKKEVGGGGARGEEMEREGEYRE